MPERFLQDRVELLCGDCRAQIATLADASIDAVVTDPPYSLVSISKRFGSEGSAPAQFGSDGRYARASAGFMGQHWDTGEVAFDPVFWAEVLRVLKPGGHVLAMGGTRTFHRLACAIEDAGFEIRDTILWIYSQGFPKNHDVGNGWGTALKPAAELVCLARKPLSEQTIAANVLKHGTGAINIAACRVGLGDGEDLSRANGGTDVLSWGGTYGAGVNEAAKRKSEGMAPLGRWPANLIHDGSEEVVAAFPDAPGQQRATGPEFERNANVYGKFAGVTPSDPRGDSGSAARFYYTAKADFNDRLGSRHPTVKPLDLMQYLIRLICPPRGVVLDPFAGTGTTGEAAYREGMRAVLIEREEAYQADIRRRMALVLSGPDERTWASVKEKQKGKPVDHGPLFATEWDRMWSSAFDLTASERAELKQDTDDAD